MTAPPVRGTIRHTELSHTSLSSPDDTTTPSLPTPTSTHATTSPTPLTPQRGRPTARYPDSLGRVPLHRRGTSNTYERLEDLLREAGYKETRVFTPERDCSGRSAAEKRDGGVGNGVRGSVGAVVDFIAGLVSRGSSMSREPASLEDSARQSGSDAWSHPPSPLVNTVHIEDRVKRVSSRASLSRNGSSENIRRHPPVDLSADVSQRPHTHRADQSSQGLPHHPHSHLRAHHHHHINRHHQQLNNDSPKPCTKLNPPNARAYLRHMVSAPNIQPLAKRPSLSQASLRSHTFGRDHRHSSRRTFILNDEDSIAESDYEAQNRLTSDGHEHQEHPPLPRNWIESVARALLSGVGGPAAVTSDAASTRTAKTASTRKSSVLSDKSNREERGRALTRAVKPPLLCAQVRDVKARTSEGQVACTRVMCRSTPTSRAGSRARGTRDDHGKSRTGGKRREGDRSGNRRKGKDRDADVVPSLARTKAENDGWMAPRQRYASGWGMQSAQAYPDGSGIWSDDSDGDDEDDDDDDDDEGELGLDRLLAPARRQHSIQSLRKHLQWPPSQVFGGRGASRPRSSRHGRASPFGDAPSGRLDWVNVSWSSSRGREWVTNRGEEDEDGYGHAFSGSEVGTGRSSTRWRRGLPGLAQWTTSS